MITSRVGFCSAACGCAAPGEDVEIDITDNGVIARDLGSTNGTYVEGHQVPAATLLDGNTITIGRTRILYWASSQDQE